ncbi:hypothetical protein KP509_03G029200 [Ceratopteris richardii]|uniref:Cryptochrome 4 n=1 Tax=Ceratopteris richardii TaxID=49495 RepID=A0A6M6CAS4_CERRI|nr:hypothetical protein KP509_03G029200 [Ceratopteris richardii]QJX57316.1 cryptochrome 4 [Ceratopteris richardii]
MEKVCTVVWLRRDLRLEDNPALCAAARLGNVVPVYIWCPDEEKQFHPGRVSRWWLKESLTHLDASLRSLGVSLVMRKAKNTLATLLEIVKSAGAKQVFFNHLYDPISLVRDRDVKQGLLQNGIHVQSFNGDLLYEPWEVLDEDGKPFTFFERYWHKFLSMPFEPESPLLPPRRLSSMTETITSCTPEELGLEDEMEKSSNALLARAWSPGWSNADRALQTFLAGPLLEFSRNRYKIDGPTTSLLSPHMHFGEISVRKVYHSVRRLQLLWAKDGSNLGEESIYFFMRSIGFREYSRYLIFNFPFTHERSLLSNLKSFPWRVDESLFKAWRQGRTGYPLVDAGMRELWATGWLHNRVRVIVSSFCVKFLQLPWRWGMKYFWDTLLDADLESDVLGWQYISGSLPDGHELDRMDNPQTEGYKHDPDGEYVRQWLPELVRLPTEWIHHPWDAPPAVLRAAGVELGSNYPRPIVEIAAARERLQQAVAKMWEQEAALNAAGIACDRETSDVNKEVKVSAPTSAFKQAMKLGSGPLSSRVSVHDQMVPNCTNQPGLRVEYPLEGTKYLQFPKLFQSTAPEVRNISHLTGKGSDKSVHDDQDVEPKNTLAPPEMSDATSTAESSSSPKRDVCKRKEPPLVWVPAIPHRPTLEFGLFPNVGETAGDLRKHLLALQKSKTQAKVEEEPYIAGVDWQRRTKPRAKA